MTRRVTRSKQNNDSVSQDFSASASTTSSTSQKSPPLTCSSSNFADSTNSIPSTSNSTNPIETQDSSLTVKPKKCSEDETNLGNYDMKARVVAEKLKGKKDLDVIAWSRSELNFFIQYRRNIYRWKKNPIILKLAKQYAGIIPNADVSDRIKNSYRVINTRGEDVYDCLVEYVGIAFEFELPVTDALIEEKFNQLLHYSGVSKENKNMSQHIVDRVKKFYNFPTQNSNKKSKRVFQNKDDEKLNNNDNNTGIENNYKKQPLNSISNNSNSNPLLKGYTKQIYLKDLESLKKFISNNEWINIYCLKEMMVQYELLDEEKMIQFGIYDRLEEDGIDPDIDEEVGNNNRPLDIFNQMLTMLYCASIDGLAKCDATFIGQIPKPKKLNILANNCNYYYTKTGWITKNFFEAYLKVLSINFQKHKELFGDKTEFKYLICDESHYHDVSDDVIPENIKLVIVNQEIYGELVRDNIFGQFLTKTYIKEMLNKVTSTLKVIKYLKPNLNQIELDKKVLSAVVKSFKMPLAEYLKFFTTLWRTISSDILKNSTEKLFHNNHQQQYLPLRADFNKQLISSNAVPARLKLLENEILNLVMELNNNFYIKNSIFHNITNILIHKPEKFPSYSLNVERLKNSTLEEDFIYKQVVKKIDVDSSINKPKPDFPMEPESIFKRASTIPSDPPSLPFNHIPKRTISVSSMLNNDDDDDEPNKRNRVSQSNPTSIPPNMSSLKIPQLNQYPMTNHHSSNETPVIPILQSTTGISQKKIDPNEPREIFKKAVYNLHLQFLAKPFGPYKNVEIYKEMTFAQILELVMKYDESLNELDMN